MTAHPITALPRDADVLRDVARKVKRVDARITELVDDMIDSMHAASGVGLAAPQIGVPLKVVVIGMPGEQPFVMINPEVVKRSGARPLMEGCLSVPGYRGRVVRSQRVLVKAQDLQGREIRIRAEDDLLAQALEHEIDHVNGTLYIDHVRSPDQLWTIEELEAAEAAEAEESSAEEEAPDTEDA